MGQPVGKWKEVLTIYTCKEEGEKKGKWEGYINITYIRLSNKKVSRKDAYVGASNKKVSRKDTYVGASNKKVSRKDTYVGASKKNGRTKDTWKYGRGGKSRTGRCYKQGRGREVGQEGVRSRVGKEKLGRGEV